MMTVNTENNIWINNFSSLIMEDEAAVSQRQEHIHFGILEVLKNFVKTDQGELFKITTELHS